jgi:YD repeat-containing protein
VTNLSYDPQSHLLLVARSGTAFQEAYVYDGPGRLRTWTGTDGYTLSFDYDNLDRLTRITYPDGTTELVVFDRLDVVEFHDRMGRVTRYQYDATDRLLSATDAANRTTTFSWCGCGALTQLTDPLGHQTAWLRDALNRVIGRQVNGQTSATFEYDGSGRLGRRTDALNQVTLYSYNVDDTLAAITYQNTVHPTPGVQFQWDFLYPRLVLMTDGFGTTTYSYNPGGVPGAGQLASITAPAPNHTITYQYDAVGRRVAQALDGVALTTTFDAEDRVATFASPLGTFAVSYDGSSSRPLGLSYPNGQGPALTYLGAAQDFRLSRLRWGPAGSAFNLSQFDYAYDAAHDQIVGLTWHDVDNPNGRFFNFSYDAAKQLTGRQQTTDPSQPPATVLHTTAFGYDQAGNRTSETIDTTVATATFDGANQLVAIERGLSQLAANAIRARRRVAWQAGAAQAPPAAAASKGAGR